METKTKLACEFVKGSDDYVNTDVSPIGISPLQNGGTLAVVRVAHPGGEWIRSGEAFKTPDGIELVYHTICDGEIAFELYGCELPFHLKETLFNPGIRITIKNICSYEDPEFQLKK
jgi:hypothetical protein